MKKNHTTIEDIKNKINELKGKAINMEVNKGRKKIEKFEAEIDNVYSSVFTVKVNSPINMNTMSYSYAEVLCGNVVINLKNSSTL